MIIGKQTKSQEKAWYERVAKFAEMHGAFPHYNQVAFQMHHAKGRSFFHNKVAVGGWFILPIETQYHDVHSNNPWNVTHWPKRYAIEFGKQKDQFVAMCMTIKDEDGSLPFDDEVLHAIMELRC
jgi:hypothetical protein